jgi:oligopeptide/dipeptide ABC transporter ATP-binding protein
MYPGEETERVMLEGEIPSALDIPRGCRFYTRCPAAVAGLCDSEQPPLYRVSETHWVSCYLVREAAEAYAAGQKSRLALKIPAC